MKSSSLCPAFLLAIGTLLLWVSPSHSKNWIKETPGAPEAHVEQAGADQGCLQDTPMFSGDAPPEAPGNKSLIGRLAELPITFVASGNPCLGPIPVYRLGLAVSDAPVASTHEMARRLAPALAAYSQNTGMEGCARMCKTIDGDIVARTVTIHSHNSCVAPENTCPEGASPIQETIHSHPPGPVFIANAVDLVGWDLMEGEGQLMWVGDPNEPSEEDRAAAPLWLVGADGKLRWLASPKAAVVELP